MPTLWGSYQIMTHLRRGVDWLCGRLLVAREDRVRLALIVGIALVIRVAWVLLFQTSPMSDAAEYDGLAWRLANGEGYVKHDGTPTAFWPVGYPAFLAAIYVVFGHSWPAAGLANALLGAVSVVLTYRLAREVLPSGPSLVAAAVVALLPSHIVSFTSVLRNEALHTVLLLVALIATCRAVRQPNLKNAVLLGLVIGVGIYVRPILLPFPLAILVLLSVRGGVSVRSAVALACVTLLVSLVTISPWTVRNLVVMGQPVLTATNGGITFYKGNGPGAFGGHRSVDPSVFSDTSELTVYREGIRMGIEHIVDHPVQWLGILPRKFFHLWASDRYNMAPFIIPEHYLKFLPVLWVIAQLYWTIIVLAAGAAALTRSVREYWLRFPAILLPLTLVYWTAFHMMFHGEGRFHVQVIPVVVVMGAHLLSGHPGKVAHGEGSRSREVLPNDE